MVLFDFPTHDGGDGVDTKNINNNHYLDHHAYLELGLTTANPIMWIQNSGAMLQVYFT